MHYEVASRYIFNDCLKIIMIKVICSILATVYYYVLGITFVAYSPLGSPGRPEKLKDEPNLLQDATIKEIATEHNVSTAQVTYNVYN